MTRPNSEEEIQKRCIEGMGLELGELYFLLWRELVLLQVNWQKYRSMFASGKSSIDLMNATAPRFFRDLETSLWHAALLHLCRLTDPPKSAGAPNLTVMQLPLAVESDGGLAQTVGELATLARKRTSFARAWRNKLLAHRDLDRAKAPGVNPLPTASRDRVEAALSALRAVLNHVEHHYHETQVAYDHVVMGPGGVSSLFHYLRLGREAEAGGKARPKRV